MSRFVSRSSQSGQVGVVILLIMVVLLTIGLSVASRTTQDLSISQQSAESARVFNAAEAGIEEALSTDLLILEDNTPVSLDSYDAENLDVNYSVRKVRRLETRVFEGVSVMVDVTGVPAGQGIQILWSQEDNCATQEPASLLVSVYSDTAGVITARHYGYQGCDHSDNFTAATSVSTEGYRRRFNLNLDTADTFVRIKPLYNDTHLRVTGIGWDLPIQYFNIRSEAVSTLGDETRIVEVNRTLPTAPSIMDFSVYSGTTLLKN